MKVSDDEEKAFGETLKNVSIDVNSTENVDDEERVQIEDSTLDQD